MKRSIAVAVVLMSLAGLTVAQTIPEEGTWGLRASIQAENATIMLPYRLNENTTISPMLGLEWIEDNSTTIILGAHTQRLLNTHGRFANYIGFKAAVLHFAPDEGDSDTSFLLGGFFGGEVFMTPRFSVGVEAGLDLEVGGDDTELGTTTGAFLTYYF